MLDSKILLGIIFLICKANKWLQILSLSFICNIKINLSNFISLIGSILSDYQTNALRCYQCIQGSNYFCDEGDMYPVTCPSDAIKCGVSIILILIKRVKT